MATVGLELYRDGRNGCITAIPPRARYPVKVTVVAWQYGNAAEPALKTAAPVERMFMIRQNEPDK